MIVKEWIRAKQSTKQKRKSMIRMDGDKQKQSTKTMQQQKTKAHTLELCENAV